MQRHELKTQRQLVNLIVSHTNEIRCRACNIELGKLVVIPVDNSEETNILAFCNDCTIELLGKKKRSWYIRLKILARTIRS